MFENAEVSEILLKNNAIKEGHFVLASYNHSATYMNLKDLPEVDMRRLCYLLAREIQGWNKAVDVVVGPQSGGIRVARNTAYVLSHLTGRTISYVVAYKEQLATGDVRYSFNERGCELLGSANGVVLVDDVMSSGRTCRRVLPVLRKASRGLLGVATICRRYSSMHDSTDIGNPEHFAALLSERHPTYDTSKKICPLCEAGIPIDQTVGRGKQYVQNDGRLVG